MIFLLMNQSNKVQEFLFYQFQEDKLPELESEVELLQKQIEKSMIPPKPVGIFAAYASKYCWF